MNFRSIFLATVQTIGLYAAGFIIPVLGQALALFTPVPVIVAYVRNGRQEGFAVLCASGIIALILGGWKVSAIFFLSFGLMAVGASEGMRRAMKPERIALLGGTLPVAVIGTLFCVYFIHIGKNPVAAVETYLQASIADASRLYTSIGLTDTAALVTSFSDRFIHYFVRLIPGVAIATSVVQTACCYAVARALIRRHQGPVYDAQPSLALWHAPDVWVWGLIAALALILIPKETLHFTGWNFAIVFAVVYLTQGIAIVDFYLRKARIRTFIRGLIIAIMLALPAIVFIIALGIVDVWADVRKVRGYRAA